VRVSLIVILGLPNIPVGLFGTVAAILGAIVSVEETKGWVRIVLVSAFLVLGAGEVATIIKADREHTAEVIGLKSQLGEIQRNTEKGLPHARVNFLQPLPIVDEPFQPFHIGQKPALNVVYENLGDSQLHSGEKENMRVLTIPAQEASHAFEDHLSEIESQEPIIGGALNPKTAGYFVPSAVTRLRRIRLKA
jgi:hypothetical protein